MSELLTHSPEQSAISGLPDVPKSRELYAGDINAAIIDVQKMAGHAIDASWWDSEVGNDGSSEEILGRFDKAYERMVWRTNKIPEEQIVALQSHEDPAADTSEDPLRINGISIPADIAKSDEIDPKIWATEEQKRREKYIFSEAEFHLNREFTIGETTYLVDGIHYTGTDGDYTTLAIDIKNVDTGAITYEVELDAVEAMIAAGQRDNDVTQSETSQTNKTPEQEPTEKNPELTRRVQEELEGFDQNAAFERAQFEAFLYEHPELLEDEPATDEEREPQAPYTPFTQTPATIDAMRNQDIIAASREQKKADAIEEFDRLADNYPEFETLRPEYLRDLHHYLGEIPYDT